MVPAARRMLPLAPGTPSRCWSSSSVSPVARGTGGSDVITWVSSAAGTQTFRLAGAGGAAGGGTGTGGGAGRPGNGADGGGAAR
jgi:hypothetical protein